MWEQNSENEYEINSKEIISGVKKNFVFELEVSLEDNFDWLEAIDIKLEIDTVGDDSKTIKM